jgi:hypothetical protein
MKRLHALTLAMTLLGGAITSLSAVTTVQAEVIYRYCMIGTPNMGTDCLFSTMQQCQWSASAGAGFCVENPRYTVYGRPNVPQSRRR